MGITVTLRGGSGDMLMADYDPDLDSKIAHGQIEDDYIEEKDINRDVLIKDTASATFATKTNPCFYIDATVIRLAAKVTPATEYIKSLKVNIRHQGAALTHAEIIVRLRKVSDDSILASKVVGYRDDEASGAIVDYTAIFDTPVYVDEEIYMSVESAGCGADDRIAPYGIAAGGAGNAYKFIAAWSQVGVAYDMYFVLDYYAQYVCVKVV